MSSATYNNQRERFFKAALENNIPELKVLLENGYRINRGDGDLYTALHRVCEHWTDKINNKNGQNKLSSSYNTATFLVSNGADVNADNPATDGWTPLHLSCWAGSIGAVQFLIDNGARVNYPDWYGATPKKIAIYAGHQEIAELITQIENKRETSKASSSRL